MRPDAADLHFLKALPYFQGLTLEDLSHIYQRGQVQNLDAGQILLLEGEPAPGLCIVRAGNVRIFKTSPEGKEQVLIVLGPGETFNDVPVFDGQPNPASAQATVPDTSVCILPTAVVSELQSTNPRIAANVIRTLAHRLRSLTTLVEDLSFHDVTHRVAKLLLQENRHNQGQVLLTQLESKELPDICHCCWSSPLWPRNPSPPAFLRSFGQPSSC